MFFSEYKLPTEKEIKEIREAIAIPPAQNCTELSCSLEKYLGWLPRISVLEAETFEFYQTRLAQIVGDVPISKVNIYIKLTVEFKLYQEIQKLGGVLKRNSDNIRSLLSYEKDKLHPR